MKGSAMVKDAKSGAKSEDSRNKGGRPKGSVSKPKLEEDMIKDLIETKCRLAEMALDNLKLRLKQSKNREEQLRITKFLGEVVNQIEDQTRDNPNQ
jgi:hypothetical protein